MGARLLLPSSSPRFRRNVRSRLESYRPHADLSRDHAGCSLQHISDPQNADAEAPPLSTAEETRSPERHRHRPGAHSSTQRLPSYHIRREEA
ncbi:uncharacterized protein C17orf67 homolog isoform X4 [Symphalangus syndactylus]|uniref:uncharacterized protein C17orf67 homolog isoform X4 n=1 Tax=Symphalangus syndactylus TaxID=9590 RepID=UPI003004DED5